MRTRDNRSHAASEGRGRGSDLAVTAGELNAGAGVGRLGPASVTCRSWYEPANSLWEPSPLYQMEVFTANQYLKDLSGKVRSGLEQKFKDKTLGYGRVPFGYRERGRKSNT